MTLLDEESIKVVFDICSIFLEGNFEIEEWQIRV